MPESSSTKKLGPEIIHLRLRELAQLFNSLDPSPFLDRDIDANAEEFIAGWARELSSRRELKLVIQLATPPPADRAAETQGAIRHYFAGRAASIRRDFRILMKHGRVSLVVGLVFLAACLALSNLFERFGASTLAGILRESFIIIGWVAMWRPLEIYLYDWWPLRAEWRVFQKLSRMEVELVRPESTPETASF